MTDESSPNRLGLLRRQHGLSQKQLAALTGVDRSMISIYERGGAIPPLAVAAIFQLHFGVSVSELFPQLFRKLQKQLEAKRQKNRGSHERRCSGYD